LSSISQQKRGEGKNSKLAAIGKTFLPVAKKFLCTIPSEKKKKKGRVRPAARRSKKKKSSKIFPPPPWRHWKRGVRA